MKFGKITTYFTLYKIRDTYTCNLPTKKVKQLKDLSYQNLGIVTNYDVILREINVYRDALRR